MNDIRDLQIQAMLQQGMTQAAIARELGVSRERVRQLVPKELYDELPQRRQRYDPVRDSRVRAAANLIEDGMTVENAAQEVGLNGAMLRNHLLKLNLPTSSRIQWTDERCEAIQRRIDAGETHAEIANQMGIDAKTLNAGLVRWRLRTGRTRPRYANWPRIYYMHQAGASIQEIADEIGCTYHNISYTLRRMRKAGYTGED